MAAEERRPGACALEGSLSSSLRRLDFPGRRVYGTTTRRLELAKRAAGVLATGPRVGLLLATVGTAFCQQYAVLSAHLLSRCRSDHVAAGDEEDCPRV